MDVFIEPLSMRIYFTVGEFCNGGKFAYESHMQPQWKTTERRHYGSLAYTYTERQEDS